MDMQAHKYKIKETFNNAAEGYDKPALRFLAGQNIWRTAEVCWK